jgi:hypothetical protein
MEGELRSVCNRIMRFLHAMYWRLLLRRLEKSTGYRAEVLFAGLFNVPGPRPLPRRKRSLTSGGK